MSDTARQPAGTPAGGQFTATAQNEPAVELGTPRRLDPAVAHMIDGRTLAHLMPGGDQLYFPDVRRELAQHIAASAPRARFGTWQDAWNDMTANGQRPIRLPSATCPQCRGKGFSTRNVARNLTRTGHPAMCGECMGRRRTSVTLQARAAGPPA